MQNCDGPIQLCVAGDIAAPTPPEMPRGLNQLGNTCYLNSLLQVVCNPVDETS